MPSALRTAGGDDFVGYEHPVEDDVVEFSATVRAAKDFDTNRLGKGLLEDRRAIGFKIRPYV